MYIDGIDETDNKILALIKENARLSYSEIGESVGISRVAVKNRVKIMETKGIIKGYHTIIDEKSALVNQVEFIIDLEVIPELFNEVMNDLAKEKYIRKICILSGRSRAQLSGFAPNTDTLAKYVDTLYYRMRGISSVTWNVVLSTLKDVDGGVDYEQREENVQEDRRYP